MRLFWALALDLLLLSFAFAALVIGGLDPFLSAFGLLIVAAPLVHLVIGRLFGVERKRAPGRQDR